MKFHKLFLMVATTFFIMPISCQVNPFLEFMKTDILSKRELKNVVVLMLGVCEKAAQNQPHDNAVVIQLQRLFNLAYKCGCKSIEKNESQLLIYVTCILYFYKEACQIGQSQNTQALSGENGQNNEYWIRQQQFIEYIKKCAQEVDEFECEV